MILINMDFKTLYTIGLLLFTVYFASNIKGWVNTYIVRIKDRRTCDDLWQKKRQK